VDEHILSNNVNLDALTPEYTFDPHDVARYGFVLNNIELFRELDIQPTRKRAKYNRNIQTRELLDKVQKQLIGDTSAHKDWLFSRGIKEHIPGTSSTTNLDLVLQEQCDLHIITDDFMSTITPMPGIIFPDVRDGKLFGIGIRNTSNNLNFVANAKWTFSNFGLYLYNYDNVDDYASICEGPFDSYALTLKARPSIAIGSSFPTPYQLASIKNRVKYREVCMDNDFSGWCGAYAIAKCFELDFVFLCKSKDPAEEIIENNSESFDKVTMDDLESMIRDGIPAYKERVQKTIAERRDLKYNRGNGDGKNS
jgi:hypothetical protein